MVTSDELWTRFRAAEFPDEVAALVPMQFVPGSGRGLDTGVYEYGPQGGPGGLILRYDDETLVAIEPGPSLTEEIVQNVESAINEEAAHNATTIARRFFFTGAPVDGWWRFRDDFQIVPAPPEAPRPDFLAGEHPFVLETKIRSSNIASIFHGRIETRFAQLRLLLNALLRNQIRELGKGSHWVRVRDPNTMLPGKTVLGLTDYYVEGIELFSERFTELEVSEALMVRPDDVHFDRVSDIFTFTIPVSLTDWLDAFFQLDSNDQRLFERAAYWYAHSSAVWRISKSASLVALVQAIEVLTPDPTGGTTCPECGLTKRPGPTAAFMDTLNRFVPEMNKKTRELLYRTRSKITHGWALLHSDFTNSTAGLVPGQVAEWQIMEMARYPVQRVLIGWLNERSGATDR